jgi:hypothetical protein
LAQVETKLTESSFHVPGGQDYCGPHRRPNDEDDTGLFGLEKEKLFDVVLIPGLKVKVDGSSDNQGRVVAKTVTVDGDRQAREEDPLEFILYATAYRRGNE